MASIAKEVAPSPSQHEAPPPSAISDMPTASPALSASTPPCPPPPEWAPAQARHPRAHQPANNDHLGLSRLADPMSPTTQGRKLQQSDESQTTPIETPWQKADVYAGGQLARGAEEHRGTPEPKQRIVRRVAESHVSGADHQRGATDKAESTKRFWGKARFGQLSRQGGGDQAPRLITPAANTLHTPFAMPTYRVINPKSTKKAMSDMGKLAEPQHNQLLYNRKAQLELGNEHGADQTKYRPKTTGRRERYAMKAETPAKLLLRNTVASTTNLCTPRPKWANPACNGD